MTSAALFLVRTTIANVLKRAALRLRQPRYLVGAAIGLFYFYWFAFRRDAVQQASRFRAGAPNDSMTVFVTLLAFAVLAGAWALAKTSPGLRFTEAEIQFFFAGPVNRRQLIAYKFFRSQLQGLFSAFMFTAFVFRGSHFLGCWIAFVALDVYTTFVAFARARLKLANIGWVWRFAAVAALVVATFVTAERQISADWAPRSSEHAARRLAEITATPPLGVILAVPRLFATAVYGQTGPSLTAAAMLVLFAAIFFVLTIWLDVSFEDESLLLSQRALERAASFNQSQAGGSATAINRIRVPFALAERGPASAAIAWKNLVGTLRMSSFPLIGLLAIVVMITAALVFRRTDAIVAMIGGTGLAIAGFFVLAGPSALRSDMRVDILRLDVVKTFPVSAEELLASEMAAPLGIIALFELLMISTSVVILNYTALAVPFFVSAEFVVSALVFIVPICAIQLLIHNGAIILFPAWNVGVDSMRGFTAIGQRLLLFIGNLAALATALFPAALLFIPSLWLALKLFGKTPIAILVATIPAAGLLVVECVFALKLLANQFENLDIANDLE